MQINKKQGAAIWISLVYPPLPDLEDSVPPVTRHLFRVGRYLTPVSVLSLELVSELVMPLHTTTMAAGIFS
eukprot:scaffold16719_cov52-Attheya_sp.AAC.2